MGMISIAYLIMKGRLFLFDYLSEYFDNRYYPPYDINKLLEGVEA